MRWRTSGRGRRSGICRGILSLLRHSNSAKLKFFLRSKSAVIKYRLLLLKIGDGLCATEVDI